MTNIFPLFRWKISLFVEWKYDWCVHTRKLITITHYKIVNLNLLCSPIPNILRNLSTHEFYCILLQIWRVDDDNFHFISIIYWKLQPPSSKRVHKVCTKLKDSSSFRDLIDWKANWCYAQRSQTIISNGTRLVN